MMNEFSAEFVQKFFAIQEFITNLASGPERSCQHVSSRPDFTMEGVIQTDD